MCVVKRSGSPKPRERIAQAKAEYAAGLVIEDEDFEAWLDALDTDEDTSLPQPRSTSQRYTL